MATRPDPRAAAIELLERALASVAIVVIDEDPPLDPLAAGVVAIGQVYRRAGHAGVPSSRH